MNFSQRHGFVPEKKEIQISSIDDEMINRLWNVIKLNILKELDCRYYRESHHLLFFTFIYHNFFKEDVDCLAGYEEGDINLLKRQFFSMEWYNVYDFLEEIMKFKSFKDVSYINYDAFSKNVNLVLEQEFSAYRLVNGKIAPITNEIEIGALEQAITTTKKYTPYSGANIHLQRSLELLSDKKNPDYRNSIKESISAVESIAKVLSENSKDSLGGALDKIKGKYKLHPSLERGFKQLYGYTSDGEGIRHALMENSQCSYDDALYMLISCSSFINYLCHKASKMGATLS